MKKVIKKRLSLIVTVSLVFAIVSCSESIGNEGESGTDTAATTAEKSEVTTTADTSDSDPSCSAYPDPLQYHVAELIAENPDAFPDVEVEKKIRWLSWYDIDEKSPAVEVFKARYGTPNPHNNDKVIDYIKVVYENRYEKLASMIMADQSPDIFRFEERFYPWGAFQEFFEPIDGVIDLSGKEWDNTRDVIDKLNWGGKNYVPVTNLVPSSALLFYRKTVIQENGLDDPYDLFRRGEWTWNALLRMCEVFSDPERDRYGIMGYYIGESAILSTGTPVIGLENGKLVSNIDHMNVERAMGFLKQLADKNYRYPYHENSNFQLSPRDFRYGNVLFWNDGVWTYQDTIQRFATEDGWNDDEVGIVPFPQHSDVDQTYQRGNADAFMLVSGSKNVDGYKAWVQSNVVADNDEYMNRGGQVKMKRDYNYTDFHLDVLEQITSLPTVWEFGDSLDYPHSVIEQSSPSKVIMESVITEGLDYTALREEWRKIIEKDLEFINNGGVIQ
ncbi:MAG: extracellular solute-binding protein [Oscillospiraceae bacterium]|nr:extracellular solute-binding protein [Oscillospiraceae bacterium]